jgi:hypothetical protein
MIIIISWITLPFLAPFITGYLIYKHLKSKQEDVNKVFELIDVVENEKPKVEPRPAGTPNQLIMYKGCVIEEFNNINGKTARIMKPSGEDLGINFKSVAEAIADIESNL